MQIRSSSVLNRVKGFFMTLAVLTIGWVITYCVIGDPALPLSTFPIFPIEYLQKAKPFELGTVIIGWGIILLYILDGLYLLIHAKPFDFIEMEVFPVASIAIWTISATTLAIQMQLPPLAVISCTVISGIIACCINVPKLLN